MNRTTYRLHSIALAPVGEIREESLRILERRLAEKFRDASCRVVKLAINCRECLNSRSGQYHATRLLEALERCGNNLTEDRVLGVTDLDLYVPNMNFVFGEASFPGRVAIISTRRLIGTTEYGGYELFPVRVVKEAVHELGHTLGLPHCETPTCVMHFSNSLGDTDLKGENYCELCSKKLRSDR